MTEVLALRGGLRVRVEVVGSEQGVGVDSRLEVVVRQILLRFGKVQQGDAFGGGWPRVGGLADPLAT